MKAHEYRMHKELNQMRGDMAHHLANLEHRLDSYLNGMHGASGREADRGVGGEGEETPLKSSPSQYTCPKLASGNAT